MRRRLQVFSQRKAEFHTRTSSVSRRKLLHGTLIVAAGAAVADALPAHADSKTSQSDAGYKSSPNGADHCELCMQFQPPSSCKIVDGSVSPQGWCKLFAHK